MRATLFHTSMVAALVAAGPTSAADVALIIGNEVYDNAESIGRVERNHDRLVAEFKKQGYRVISGKNLDRADMYQLLADFDGFLPDAEKVVVYFAGHILNAGGETWLAPTDLAADSQVDVEFNAPSLSLFMDLLASQPGRSAIFLGSPEEGFEPTGVLDSGIGALEVAQGLLVISGDSDAVYSVVSSDFLSSGMTVSEAVTETDEEVVVQGFVSPDLVLAGSTENSTPPVNPTAAILAERTFWALTETGDTVRDYEDYLRRYPSGVYAKVAQARIAALSQPRIDPVEQAEIDLGLTQAERRRIQEQLTVLGYNPRGVDGVFGLGSRTAIRAWQRNEQLSQTGYLTREQVTLMARLAKIRSDEIAAEAERQRREQAAADTAYWRATGASGRAADLRAYLVKYPDGIYAADAKAALDRIERNDRDGAERAEQSAWDTARSENSIRSYENYLALYPRGVFVDIAEARLDALRDADDAAGGRAELEAIEANLGLNNASRTLIERRLDSLGHEPGTIDGTFDRNTRRAIRQFQQSQRIDVTGYLNANTVRQLIVASIR